MRTVRLFVVTVLAAATLGLSASPALACPPDGYCPPCGNEKIDAIWTKVTGHPLFNCPW